MADGFRLSPQQRHLWRGKQAAGGAAWQTSCTLRLGAAAADVTAADVAAAVAQLDAEHEILRTSFEVAAGLTLPLQVVAPPGGASRLVWELSDGADDADGARRLHLRLPALCADRLGMRALAVELARRLVSTDGGSGGEENGAADEEPLQYADLAEWLNELLESEEAATADEVRRRLAAALPAPALLPFGRGEDGEPSDAFAPASVPLTLPAGSGAAVAALAAAAGLTATDVLLTAWRLTLDRLLPPDAGAAVGRTWAGRRADELRDAVGLFARTLPVAPPLPAGADFLDAVAATTEAAAEAERWQEYLEPAALPFPLEVEEPPHLGVDGVEIVDETAVSDRFALRLSGWLAGDGGAEPRLALDYDAARFDAADARRAAESVATLLAAAVERPRTPVAALPVLGAAERRRLLVELNQAAAEAAGGEEPRSVEARVAAHAVARPDETALRGDGRQLTFGELERATVAVARRLRQRGAGPGAVVALAGRRTPELVAALLGVLRAGAAYLPLDPALPDARLHLMARDAGVRLIVADAAAAPRFAALDGVEVLALEEAVAAGGTGSMADPAAAADPADPADSVDPGHLAYVMYTSGSTGAPNGVMVSRRGLAAYVAWAVDAYRVAQGSGAPVHSSLGFDLTVTSLLVPLAAGRRADLMDDGDGAVEELARALAEGRGYSLVKLTPAHLEAVGRLAEPPADGAPRALVLGGEALYAESLEAWRSRCPEVRVVNEYGPTETVVGCCVHDVAAGELEPGAVPIGRPVAGARLYVVDAAGGPVPLAVAGELLIGGPGVARGYLGRPALTAHRFVPDPFSGRPGARLYRSGDLVRHRRDGALEYLGRVDHQVKVRGFRIEPGEIEAALRAHPAVEEAAVVARREAAGQRRLVAWLTATGDTAAEGGADGGVDDATLRTWLAGRLPEFMVPAAFGWLPELPLTGNGKVDRRALAEAPAPDGAAEYAAPSTPAQEALAAIWADVLGRQRIGVEDDFFQLGGDSILSIQVVSRARRAGFEMVPRDLFDHRTVAALAAAVARSAAPGQAAPRAEPPPAEGEIPLTPIQRWFFAAEPVDRHHFNQSLLLTAGGDGEEPEPGRLAAAVAVVLGRHDALRLRFPAALTAAGRAVHAAPGTPPATPALPRLDLSALPPARRRPALTAAAGRLQASLDPAAGPLLRAALFELGGGTAARLFLVAHHLVMDGVSWRVLLEDLATAYAGGAAALAPRTAPFADWARHLAAYAADGGFAAEAEHWRRQAERAAAAPPLPGDGAAGAGRLADVETASVELDAAATEALLQRVPAAYGGELQDALLAALAGAVAALTGGALTHVDLEGHGREDLGDGTPDVSRSVGWFTSLYPVLLEVPADAAPGDALKAVKEQLRGVPRRGVGYGALRWLSEDLPAAPAAEILFNYLGRLDAAAGRWRRAPEPAGMAVSPAARRSHPLDVVALIEDGRLHTVLRYNPARLEPVAMAALAEDFRHRLMGIVEHCAAPGAARYTPSDFPAADLSQEDLDRVMQQLGS